jgi:transglutaminase-like putative cysteine protease
MAEYTTKMGVAGISPEYLVDSDSFDIYSPDIQAIAAQALTKSDFDDALKFVIGHTYDNICYTLAGNDCKETSASQVITRGYGLCSTMSMVNIAVLRSMGIAARPVSGCYKSATSCNPVLSIFPEQPKLAPAYFEDDRVYIGRVDTGQQGPHAWVEVWHPEKGWLIIESTLGEVIPSSCANYRPVYINTVNIEDFCSLPKEDYYRCLES